MLQRIPEAYRGYALALIAVGSFSLATLLTKFSLNQTQLDFYSLAIWGWGSGILLATLLFYLPLKSQRQVLWPQLKQHYRFFALIAVLTIINGGTWFYGMSQINGGVVALIDQNVLVWTFLLGALFLHERFSWRQLSAIGITLIGLGIISSLKGEVTTLGVLCLITCGASIATQSLLIKKYPQPFNALCLTFWRGWAMVIAALGVWTLLGHFNAQIEPLVLLSVCIGQFFGLFAGRAAYIKAHEFLPMSHLSFFMLGIPVMVLMGSFVWLGEPISTQKIVGAGVMLFGLTWFLTRRAKKHQPI